MFRSEIFSIYVKTFRSLYVVCVFIFSIVDIEVVLNQKQRDVLTIYTANSVYAQHNGNKWFMAIVLVVNSKKNLSSCQLGRNLGITQQKEKSIAWENPRVVI